MAEEYINCRVCCRHNGRVPCSIVPKDNCLIFDMVSEKGHRDRERYIEKEIDRERERKAKMSCTGERVLEEVWRKFENFCCRCTFHSFRILLFVLHSRWRMLVRMRMRIIAYVMHTSIQGSPSSSWSSSCSRSCPAPLSSL